MKIITILPVLLFIGWRYAVASEDAALLPDCSPQIDKLFEQYNRSDSPGGAGFICLPLGIYPF